MFRGLKLLLSVTAICGVLSLAVFYVYTARHYYHKNLSNVLNIGKLTASNLKLPTVSVRTREVTGISSSNLPFTGALTTQAPAAQNTTTGLKNEGEDSVDKLIETSLEKSKKRGHGDGDEETTELPSEKDTDQDPETNGEISTSNIGDQEKPTKITDDEEENLELCPAKPPSLTGPLFVNQNVPKMEDLEKHFSEEYGGWVRKGGSWKPSHCKARVKMVLIIPFRKRYEQLAIFVRHMHPMLKRQEIDYRIIVVEQSGSTPFNRAILFNIGYKEALKINNYNCFIFHDVDLLPEDDRNMYTCPTSPRHMSVAVDKFNYHLPYASIFGGAGAFLRKDFEEINGFSNKFWGWGGEDDDLYQRVVSKGHHLSRPSAQIGRYKMVRIHHHQSSKADPNSGARIRTARIRMLRDGLNSLKYKVLRRKEEPMYTIVTIAVNPKDYKKSS